MYTLKIVQDEDPLNPRTEFDNASVMALFHKRYTLGDKDVPFSSDEFHSWDEMRSHIETKLDALCLPVYMYDHSGITIRTTPFSSPLYSGQVGFVYMTRESILQNWGEARMTPELEEKAYNLMLAEIDDYDKCLTGDVWGYVIEGDEGEQVDSCWGFYGEDYCRQEGERVLAALIANTSPRDEFMKKAERILSQLSDLIQTLPDKGDTSEVSQKVALVAALNGLQAEINGVQDEDFETEPSHGSP